MSDALVLSAPAPARRLLPTKQVCRRYDVCAKTLDRWDDDPTLGFPPPIVINRRKYRDEAALEVWERARMKVRP